MTDTTMPNWLTQRAKLTPNRTAIETKGKSITFGELNKLARNLAAQLHYLGAGAGVRVAILQSNTISMISTYHALSYLGAIAVPLNVRLTVSEIIWQVEDCQAAFLLYDDACERLAKEIKQKNVKVFHIESLEDISGQDTPILRAEISLSDPHTIIYTSGTTGRPKGVILTYGNHWWSAIGSALNLGLSINDKWLLSVPMFHVSGLSILMKSVIYGMTVFLQPKFIPSEVNEAILECGVTMISVVSAMVTKLLDDLKDRFYPDYFRCMLLGGGPAPLPLLEKCREKNIPIFQTYGLSETASQIVTLSPEYMIEKLGSAGKPLFPSQIKIVDPEGRDCKANEEGEIIVKGPNVTGGYWNKPEATKKAFANGWLHTGDIGYLDDEGFLFVLDRRKDMIISGGENIYPAEVEATILAHPDVVEVGVVGVKDAHWGQVPAAFVKTSREAELAESDIQMYCRDHLAGYKVPKYVFFVDELPRNASGKLLRRYLVDRLPGDLR
ncbi:MAG: o-succinylbenzoate--CoA ligase [Tuberibacillus sp.]